jgi:hypothetical protein
LSSRDAAEVYWVYVDSLGVQSGRLRALTDRLESDFRASDGGYGTLQALVMPQRAIVSDQILGGAQGTTRNLLEARLHERDVNSLLAEGVPLDEPTPEGHERDAKIDMGFVGFFRGLGSALDCIAGTAIGVLRLPFSIRRASFSKLLGLNENLAGQHQSWNELKELIAEQADEPPGWLRWTLEMRHAFMHRPRLMSLMLPREAPEPPLWLPNPAKRLLMRERLRFDPHFRRRPWLPDMQHLADPQLGGFPQAVLGERATQTVRGCFEATNMLTERLAELLLAKWDDEDVAAISPPDQTWITDAPLDLEFGGFAPASFPSKLSAGLISPHDAERIRLAAELHRSGHI